MRAWFIHLWDITRSSFWFMPSMFLLATLMVSISLVELDEFLKLEKHDAWNWIAMSATSAQAILATLAGAMVTVTGLVFSMTMLTLAQTSSQYGSRLMRNLLESNVTQFTLGVFLSTSLFCFVVLRNVRQSGEDRGVAEFVPHIATTVSLMFGLFSLIVFIYFVHQVSRSIQAQSIVDMVSTEFYSTIDRLYPDEIENGKEELEVAAPFPTAPPSLRSVSSVKYGYVQSVNLNVLLQIARNADCVLRTHVAAGEFVHLGTNLCSIVSGECAEWDEGQDRQVSGCFILGNQRIPRQDIECALNELVEIAVRALSPGINDPFTALSCVDYITNGFCKLVKRKSPANVHSDEDGTVRLIMQSTTFPGVLNAGLNQIRQYSGGAPAVLIRLIEGMTAIANSTHHPEILSTLRKHGEMIVRASENSVSEQEDHQDLLDRVEIFQKALTSSESVEIFTKSSGIEN